VRPILLVDDDADAATAVAQALEREGYVLQWAASAEVALDHLRGGRVPGLILLDHRMPGMTGARLLGMLNADPALRGIPVVLVSGDPIGLEKAKALGAEAAIEKPFDAVSLLSVVNAYFRAS
jgi:CheY-like chemotaxis protein